MTGTVDPMADNLLPHLSSNYDTSSGPLAKLMYLTGSSQDMVAEPHTSHSHHHHSSHQNHRDQEVDLCKHQENVISLTALIWSYYYLVP